VFEGNKSIASRFSSSIFDKSYPIDGATEIELLFESVFSGGVGKSSDEDGLVSISVWDVFVLKWLPY
jgi:hypothetical protein